MPTTMTYSSKDFGRTRGKLEADLPERLVHRDVESNARDEQFSGERKHPVFVVDLPSKVLSLTIGGLAPGQSTNRHRHTYETIIYVLEGEGFTMVEDRKVTWRAGDAVYIPTWAWHQHTCTGERACRYVACENAPMLQNLGVALREEG
jgi:quercetin dioxygenase-like cupin family protein